jgi:hypothetical protein
MSFSLVRHRNRRDEVTQEKPDEADSAARAPKARLPTAIVEGLQEVCRVAVSEIERIEPQQALVERPDTVPTAGPPVGVVGSQGVVGPSCAHVPSRS